MKNILGGGDFNFTIMKILHIVSFNYSHSNGIKAVLESLIPEQISLGHIVTVVNISRNIKNVFPIEFYVSNQKGFIQVFLKVLPDIVVFHSNYQMKFYSFARWLVKNRIPYLIVPHGGTGIQNMKKKHFQKILLSIFFTKKFVTDAQGVVFLNKQEKEDSYYLPVIKNACVIPNGTSRHIINIGKKANNDCIHFFYLARIDFWHKGLDVLLNGIEDFWRKNQGLNCDFHFYGGSKLPDKVIQFKNILSQMSAPIYYHGEVFGEEKKDAFINGNIYILTSRFEGMPLTVLEALSFGNPCIISPYTNMSELINKNNVGWITDTNRESIAKVLEIAYKEDKANKISYIERSLDSVIPYTWQEIAKKTIELYKSVTADIN